MRRILIATLMLLQWTQVHAQEADDGTRSPGDLNAEERIEMMQLANAYHTCVYNTAMAGIDAHEDIRHIADQALGECDDRLGTLGETISGWGFPHGFAESFTRSVRDRAVHQLLPELAVRKGG